MSEEYMDALLKFAFDGKKTRTGNDITDAFISAFEPQIEANKKRRSNGKKGGRPKKEKTNGSEEEETNGFENKKANVNVNVNENVNGNVNGNANSNVNVSRTPPIDAFYTDFNERRKAKQ